MTMIKICRQCGLEAEHYQSITTHCKECWKSRVRLNRKNNIEHYRKFDRERAKTSKRKLQFLEKQRRKRASMGPIYDYAHAAVARGIKRGSVIQPDHCERCMINCVPQAHHDDHNKPLEVLWLCPICHAARHVELGRLN